MTLSSSSLLMVTAVGLLFMLSCQELFCLSLHGSMDREDFFSLEASSS